MNINERWQTLFLIVLILISVSLTKFERGERLNSAQKPVPVNVSGGSAPNLSFKREASLGQIALEEKGPRRNWDILDPPIKAHAVLIHSLDTDSALLSYKSESPWPMASLAKLLSAVIVLEEIGPNKKIPVSRSAVLTEGEAGGLEAGEIYTSRDMLKIMILASSNDAAAAFEEYLGGRSYFVKLLNQKAAKLGMAHTVLHDASGLQDINETTTSDMLKLALYILEKHPDIFSWSRFNSFLVQPINGVRSHTVLNINSFVSNPDFLGGKTGTSPEAGENLVALFSLGNMRVIEIILGSPSRAEETQLFFEWVKRAYTNKAY